MKKKTMLIIASVLIIATLCFVFTACNGKVEIKVSDLPGANPEGMSYGPATVTGLDVADGLETYEHSVGSDLVVFKQETVAKDMYYVIDVADKEVHYLGTYQAHLAFTTSYSLIFPDVYMVMVEDEEGGVTVSFYHGNELIVQGVETQGLLDNNHRILYDRYDEETGLDIGGGKVIVNENGKYTVKDKKNPELSVFNRREVTELEDYCVYFYNGNEFSVLDKNSLTAVRTVTFEGISGERLSDMSALSTVVLPGNKILFQSLTIMPENTTKDYDFYAYSSYYKYSTYIYDIEKDKTEKIKDCKYIFNSDFEYLTEQGVTICEVTEITENKTLGAETLQGFDGDLNIVFDIQAILPYTETITRTGDYTIFRSSTRIVVYKGDTRVADIPASKIYGLSVIVQSELFADTENGVLYNIDGSYLTSLSDLQADCFVSLDYAQNYVLFEKTETDETGTAVYLYSFNKKTGETLKIAPTDNVTNPGYGFIVVENAEDQSRTVYDVVNMQKVLENVSYGNLYITECDSVLLMYNYSYETYSVDGYYVIERS